MPPLPTFQKLDASGLSFNATATNKTFVISLAQSSFS
jgi:hypothetical protein